MQWPEPNPRWINVNGKLCPIYLYGTTSGKINEFVYIDWLEKGVFPNMVPGGPPVSEDDITLQGLQGCGMWKEEESLILYLGPKRC